MSTPNARVILDQDFTLGSIDPRLFGGFAEHLGRHIYTGMYEPGHATADAQGFRTDVLELVRELDMPIMRYPGGNFVSGYNWEDGVGPLAQRPSKLDLAWRVTEPNTFGTHEFIDWCKKAHTAPMLAVNLGTRGPDSARELLEYCNHPGGSYWSDLRKQHGYAQPHNVRLWCLGNEMDGHWQIGHKTATEYGRVAAETARVMKFFDPKLELIVCGSSNRTMASFGSWELEVLEHTYEHVDYLSIHSYYGKDKLDTQGYLGWADHMDRYIEDVIAFTDAVAGKRRSFKRIHLSFDEWNVWGSAEHKLTDPWPIAPPSHEAIYTVEDALAFAGLLLSLINHADRVKIGCLAQVVNVIAPIVTQAGGPAWRQSIFYPFAHASRYGRGEVLRPLITSTTYNAGNGDGFPHLKMAAVRSSNADGLTLFMLNRSARESLPVQVDLRSFANLQLSDWTVLSDDDLSATNTAQQPNRVQPRTHTGASLQKNQLSLTLPKASWNVVRLNVMKS